MNTKSRISNYILGAYILYIALLSALLFISIGLDEFYDKPLWNFIFILVGTGGGIISLVTISGLIFVGIMFITDNNKL